MEVLLRDGVFCWVCPRLYNEDPRQDEVMTERELRAASQEFSSAGEAEKRWCYSSAKSWQLSVDGTDKSSAWATVTRGLVKPQWLEKA
jgi:hypothetical protein